MKIKVTQYSTHFELSVTNEKGMLLHSYVFDTKKECEAFCSGFSCAKFVANQAVQSLASGCNEFVGLKAKIA